MPFRKQEGYQPARDVRWAKRRATDCLTEEVGGVVTRVGDESAKPCFAV